MKRFEQNNIAGLTGRSAILSAVMLFALSSCGPTEPPRPLPGDPVEACRAGIQEACGVLRLQQYTMQQVSRPVPVLPVQVYQPRSTHTNCQRTGDFTSCRTSYQ